LPITPNTRTSASQYISDEFVYQEVARNCYAKLIWRALCFKSAIFSSLYYHYNVIIRQLPFVRRIKVVCMILLYYYGSTGVEEWSG